MQSRRGEGAHEKVCKSSQWSLCWKKPMCVQRPKQSSNQFAPLWSPCCLGGGGESACTLELTNQTLFISLSSSLHVLFHSPHIQEVYHWWEELLNLFSFHSSLFHLLLWERGNSAWATECSSSLCTKLELGGSPPAGHSCLGKPEFTFRHGVEDSWNPACCLQHKSICNP